MRWWDGVRSHVKSGRAVAIVGLTAFVGTGLTSAAQVPAGSVATVPSAAPLMTAAFPVPHTQAALQPAHLLRACQSVFERTMRIALRVELATTPATTPASAPDASSALLDDSTFTPIPPVAVTAGRACLSRIGDTQTLAALDLPLLLRLAIGVNDDTLVDEVVTRQLALAGTNVRERGHVLETVVDELLHNRWGGVEPVRTDHRTVRHDALAQRYAAVLDTMQPAGQVLASRLHVMAKLADAHAPVEWDVDDQLARQRAQWNVATSVPLSAVPPEDTAEVRTSRSPIALAWTTYLKTPTHDNLARWIVVRDSMLHLPAGQTMDSLLNRPAPSLTGDYWFNLPAGATAPSIPAPGVVSLLVFGNDLDSTRAAQVRALHATYPALQIVMVAMTRGTFAGENLHAEPAREAALIHRHLTDELRLPGIVCVLQTRYHTEPSARTIPLPSPVLERFHLDPRMYAGHIFVVDAQGVLVNDRPGAVLDGHLIQRLLLHQSTQEHEKR